MEVQPKVEPDTKESMEYFIHVKIERETEDTQDKDIKKENEFEEIEIKKDPDSPESEYKDTTESPEMASRAGCPSQTPPQELLEFLMETPNLPQPESVESQPAPIPPPVPPPTRAPNKTHSVADRSRIGPMVPLWALQIETRRVAAKERLCQDMETIAAGLHTIGGLMSENSRLLAQVSQLLENSGGCRLKKQVTPACFEVTVKREEVSVEREEFPVQKDEVPMERKEVPLEREEIPLKREVDSLEPKYSNTQEYLEIGETTISEPKQPETATSSKDTKSETGGKSKSDEKPFKCKFCDYRCAQKRTLRTHMCIHTGEKPYKCNVCDYRCIQNGNMRKHIRKHSGEKPYKCDTCDRGFISSFELTRHMRIHSGEKPYKCETCDYRSADLSTLKKHIRIHTGEKPYECKDCNRRFTYRCDLTRHIRTHTGENPCK